MSKHLRHCPKVGQDTLTDLQTLRDWLACPTAQIRIEALITRLGTVAVPLLGRALASADPIRRDAARVGFGFAGRGPARTRVVGELRSIVTAAHGGDDTKSVALALLADLGAREDAKFDDAGSILRRSVSQFAAQLESRADITSAADLVVRQAMDVLQFLSLLDKIAPSATIALADELAVRLDLAPELRAKIVELYEAPDKRVQREPTSRSARRIAVTILVDAAARLVVIASRKLDARRVRRWAVLIGHTGRVDDCLYDIAGPDAATSLVENLCADGYQVASTDRDRARAIVTGAARRTGAALTSQYYFGRDLLDLADAHVAARPRSLLARVVELLADGQLAEADTLLDRCDAANPDVCATRAAIALARGDHAAAIAPLERAISLDPEWPLHHWNLGVARYRLGDMTATLALQRFVATSAAPTGLYGDAEQPGRIACAERMIAELERRARLLEPDTTRARARRSRTRRSPQQL
ncbi:MAG: tetratricopeptide repeat protein [Proteobacteria bacterium]|nr:tetratricopeptide repeat protein [Pseudomonadota bacterium]